MSTTNVKYDVDDDDDDVKKPNIINEEELSAIDRAKKSIAPQNKLEDWKEREGEVRRCRAIAISESSVAVDGKIFNDNVARVNGCTYEHDLHGDTLPHVPTVLTGLMDEWPVCFKCCSSTPVSLDGGPSFARMSMSGGKVTLHEYEQYCENQADNDTAPLYVFDPDILKSRFAMEEEEFPIPPCFSKDAMSCINGTQYRPLPPHWLLVGVARSGTPIHDHPMTIAWNAMIAGCKLWVCLPPDVDESLLLLNLDDEEEEGDGDSSSSSSSHRRDFDLSAIEWFHQCGDLPDDARIIVQRPGEVVYLPAGWFHVILNVETSTAISASLALRRDLPTVLPLLRTYDEEFATFWVNRMSKELQTMIS